MNKQSDISLGELDMIIFNVGVIASNCTDLKGVRDYFIKEELGKGSKRLVEYQERLLDTYDDNTLYVIINELKGFYFDEELHLPVNRLISGVSKGLYERLPLEKKEDFSQIVVSFCNEAYEMIDGLDNEKVLKKVFNYLEKVGSVCTVEEERALASTLGCSESSITGYMVESINMDIYTKTFKDYFSNKDIGCKVKK